MTTITQGATTITPLLVLGYSSKRGSGNIIHDILGTGNPDVTFNPAGLRKGTLELLCADHTAALALENLHRVSGYFTLADSDLPGIGMRYVPSGEITAKLDPDTRTLWVVTVDFQEVPT